MLDGMPMESSSRRNGRGSFRRIAAAALSLLTAALFAASGLALPARPAAAAEPGAALAPRALPVKSLEASLGHGRDPRVLVVKLRDGAGARAVSGKLEAAGAPASAGPAGDLSRDLSSVATVLASQPGIVAEPLFRLPEEILDHLRAAGQERSGEELADLTQFFLLRLPEAPEPVAMLEDLLALEAVENAYAYGVPRTPADIPPTTPDFLNNPPGQGYRDPAPLGIDIAAAWARGFTGDGLTVIDVETNWNLAHEDLDHLAGQTPPVAVIPPSDWRDPALPSTVNLSHGMATLGVIGSGDNGYGTTGLAPDAKIRVVPAFRVSDPGWLPPNSVVLATLNMQPGDVMLIELEDFAGFPFETFDAEYASVRQATALGIHVIEPAGNFPGGIDLDDLDPSGTGFLPFDLAVRDSGAVLVGASNSTIPMGFHTRYVNSNYGGRVDSFSWGQDITTLGYGPNSSSLANCANAFDPFPLFPPDINQWYTHCYNGTSGAGSIVAGAAAVLGEKHRQKWNRAFGARELRNMLRLGTPIFGDVGHQPDLKYQLNFMDRGGIITHRFKHEPRRDSFASVQQLGRAVDGAGDVDGDGVPDLVVGIPGYTLPPGGSVNQHGGRVQVLSGATGRILYDFLADSPGDNLGFAVSGGGDANGDGVPDVAAGAWGDDGAGAESGSVRLYSGADGTVLYTLSGLAADERFGHSVDFVSDIDGDGADEILVGAPGDTDQVNGVGVARLFSGATGSLIRTVTHPQQGSLFGASVADAGDVDGDGTTDFIVGIPNLDDGLGHFPGAAIVYGGAGGVLRLLRGEVPLGIFSFSGFGADVDGAGDVDGDGLADLLVGAPGWTQTPGAFGFGKIYIFASSGQLLDAFVGQQKGDGLGRSVAGVGDFNGDGHDDVAAGQPSHLSSPGFPGRNGRVFVFFGPFPQPAVLPVDPVPAPAPAPSPSPAPQPAPVRGPGAVSEDAVVIIAKPIPTSNNLRRVFWTKDGTTLLGVSVGATGDVNGDGKADVVAGEPYGDSEGLAWVFSIGPAPDMLTGVARLLADAGVIESRDVNGNGFGGGGFSPSETGFYVDAGQAWAGADYSIFAVPNPPWDTNATAQSLVAPGSSFIVNPTGTLDGTGRSSAPVFGPILASLLCPGLIGANFSFFALVQIDFDGDGVYDASTTTLPALVTIINEFGGAC